MNRYSFNQCNNCNICKFSENYFYINLSKNFKLPIMVNANCNTESVIYIITCKKCNIFYIGETGKKVKLRIQKHLNNIKSYLNFELNYFILEILFIV